MIIKMDLYGKDQGNISLPRRLQTIDFDETKLKDVIINTQKCFYDLKIAEINKKIQRYLCKITILCLFNFDILLFLFHLHFY